ncbi:YncE family protein [Bacillus thuringiensis]|uniref:YncE family protein n=1 Tax=Bacillus thuringiensis TaxID=1428 RepID=UPI0011A701FE|nr:hypothetical protein [Bacillus thuringiensis]
MRIYEFTLHTNLVFATIPVGSYPIEVAVNPNTNLIYATNTGSNTVSVIDLNTNSVIATIPVGSYPFGIDVLIR